MLVWRYFERSAAFFAHSSACCIASSTSGDASISRKSSSHASMAFSEEYALTGGSMIIVGSGINLTSRCYVIQYPRDTVAVKGVDGAAEHAVDTLDAVFDRADALHSQIVQVLIDSAGLAGREPP